MKQQRKIKLIRASLVGCFIMMRSDLVVAEKSSMPYVQGLLIEKYEQTCLTSAITLIFNTRDLSSSEKCKNQRYWHSMLIFDELDPAYYRGALEDQEWRAKLNAESHNLQMIVPKDNTFFNKQVTTFSDFKIESGSESNNSPDLELKTLRGFSTLTD